MSNARIMSRKESFHMINLINTDRISPTLYNAWFIMRRLFKNEKNYPKLSVKTSNFMNLMLKKRNFVSDNT